MFFGLLWVQVLEILVNYLQQPIRICEELSRIPVDDFA